MKKESQQRRAALLRRTLADLAGVEARCKAAVLDMPELPDIQQKIEQAIKDIEQWLKDQA